MTNRGIIRNLQLICRGNSNPFSTNLGCFLCLYLFLNLKFDLPIKISANAHFPGEWRFHCSEMPEALNIYLLFHRQIVRRLVNNNLFTQTPIESAG